MKTYVLQTSPIPQPNLRALVASWLCDVPYPATFEVAATTRGVRVRVFTSERTQAFEGYTEAFAAMTKHALRWRTDTQPPPAPSAAWYIEAMEDLPLAQYGADPFLVWAGRLKSAAQAFGGEIALRITILRRDSRLQSQLRALSAYNYGTSAGVSDDEPNPWAIRLGIYRALIGTGMLATGVAGGAAAADWMSPVTATVIGAAGLMGFGAGLMGVYRWIRVRNIPRETLEDYASDVVLRVAFGVVVRGGDESRCQQAVQTLLAAGAPLSGPTQLHQVTPSVDLAADAYDVPLPATHVASILTPPEVGDPASLMHPDDRMDVPTPPPSEALRNARYQIAVAVATGEPVGIDPDGHGLIVGGSRSGKSSLAAGLLRRLLEDPDPPGLFLVDPHLSLADSFLSAVDELPEPRRTEAIQRLRVITPDQPEVVPLNLLAVPDFAWAGSALIQVGQRIWTDYWGPRMQAALMALFKLAHGWNQKLPPGERFSLVHTIFAVFNPEWRRQAMWELPPAERPGVLALDALLGQLGGGSSNWQQGWATEVASPIISKVMALDLSPWLFQALHQGTFVDLENAIRERAWIVLRIASGTMGGEAARLLVAVVYNVWEAAFRRTASPEQPIPYLVLVDEAQEIAGGMRLESLLAEGAKFGARLFVLTQSLAMMRKIDGFDPVVQSLLANTSTQAFFSPDPDDVETIRNILSSEMRYGEMTLDLPTLHAWLRARIGGRWQPPTVIRGEPLPAAHAPTVQALIREVIERHPDFYTLPQLGIDAMLNALIRMVPPSVQHLLGEVAGTTQSQASQATSSSRLKALGFDE